MKTLFETTETNRGGWPILWAKIVVFPKTCTWRFHVFFHSRVEGVKVKGGIKAFNTPEEAVAAATNWIATEG